MACSPARTAQRAGVPGGSVDLYLGCSRSGDRGGRDRDCQLFAARYRGALRGSIDVHNGSRNKLAAVHRKEIPLLHLTERDRAGGKGRDDRGWASASTQGVERIAALEDQQSKRHRNERQQEGTDSSHSRSYHALDTPHRLQARATRISKSKAAISAASLVLTNH